MPRLKLYTMTLVNIRDTITDEDEVKKEFKKLESFETNIENKASKTKRDIKFYESKSRMSNL